MKKVKEYVEKQVEKHGLGKVMVTAMIYMIIGYVGLVFLFQFLKLVV